MGRVAASFGIGLASPTPPVPAQVVAAVGAALYRSKADGRNRVSGPEDDHDDAPGGPGLTAGS